MKAKVLSGLLLLGLGFFNANGFPIAPAGTEGFAVVTAGTDPVIATYEGNSASYSNNLYLERDALGNPASDGIVGNDLFIFNNHANTPGDTLNIGSFAAGVELIFRLEVTDTGNNFFSGAASRNPDSSAHARVQSNYLPGVTLVSFEDLYNGPFDYNDLSFTFTNTRGTPNPSVPDSGSTALGLGIALAGLSLVAKHRKAICAEA